MLLKVVYLTNMTSLASSPTESGSILSVIIGGLNPYKAWKGVVFRDVWNEVLYHHSAVDR
jgi:hypothetical protein